MPYNDAHVWLARPEDCLREELVAYYESLLNPAETQRMQLRVLPHLRHEFVVTRALCRTMLAEFTGAAPRAIQFASNAYGRPEIAFPLHARGLSFNLSNMPGLVACGIARNADIGLDIASRSYDHDDPTVVARYFARAERDALASLPSAAQPDYFQVLWALKESYVKACGTGLTVPLAAFAMDTSGERIAIEFADANANADRHTWQFELVRPDTTHVVAIALRKPSADHQVVHTQTVVPGVDHSATISSGRYRQS